MRIFVGALIIAWSVFAGGAARADWCYGQNLESLWLKIASAYGQGNLSAVKDDLTMLADAGFGPAELVLGRMYAQENNDKAAFLWLALAKHNQIGLADSDIYRVGQTLTQEDRDQLRNQVQIWRAKPSECGATSKYQVPKFFVSSSLGLNPKVVVDWWGKLLVDTIGHNPNWAPYLMSVKQVEIIADGPVVGVLRYGVEMVLTINKSALDDTLAETEARILAPVQVAVNEPALMAMTGHEEETYKGFHIMMWPVGDTATILDIIRKTIDMVDTLPKPLHDRAIQIKELRYIPQPNFNAAPTSIGDVLYYAESETQPIGYLLLQFEPNGTTPANLAIDFVETSLYREWHKQYVAGKNHTDEHKEQMWAMLRGAPNAFVFPKVDDCRRLGLVLETAKALELPEVRIRMIDRDLGRHGCLD